MFSLSGTTVTFQFVSGHNVNTNLDSNYNNKNIIENNVTCQGLNSTSITGSFIWTAPTQPGIYYFACGVGDGFHCSRDGGDMRAAVTVE